MKSCTGILQTFPVLTVRENGFVLEFSAKEEGSGLCAPKPPHLFEINGKKSSKSQKYTFLE